MEDGYGWHWRMWYAYTHSLGIFGGRFLLAAHHFFVKEDSFVSTTLFTFIITVGLSSNVSDFSLWNLVLRIRSSHSSFFISWKGIYIETNMRNYLFSFYEKCDVYVQLSHTLLYFMWYNASKLLICFIHTKKDWLRLCTGKSESIIFIGVREVNHNY